MNLSCFRTYDIRGKVGIDIDNKICSNIGRALFQHLRSKSIVVGFDARESSPSFAKSVANGILLAGSDVIMIGMAGTEEMYWAVSEFKACGGITITASHNPINYNGMKLVKSGSAPLNDKEDFQLVRKIAETESWIKPPKQGKIYYKEKTQETNI